MRLCVFKKSCRIQQPKRVSGVRKCLDELDDYIAKGVRFQYLYLSFVYVYIYIYIWSLIFIYIYILWNVLLSGEYEFARFLSNESYEEATDKAGTLCSRRYCSRLGICESKERWMDVCVARFMGGFAQHLKYQQIVIGTSLSAVIFVIVIVISIVLVVGRQRGSIKDYFI